MRFFIYLFISFALLTQSFAADFEDLKTDNYSLTNAYLELMQSEKLIHQTDVRLKKRQLLKRDGGLCAFTAAVNAVQATSQYYQIYTHKFLKQPDYFLYEVIDEARSYMENDPTHAGIDFISLVKYLNDVLENYGLDQIVHVKHKGQNEVTLDSFDQLYWKVRLLGLLSQDGEEGHTVVLLKVDNKKKVIYTSDPNYPNKIIESRYKKVGNNYKVYLSDDFPGFQPALIDEMIEVNVNTD